MIVAGNNGVSVCNAIPHPRNVTVGVCDVTMNGRNGRISARCEFLLEAES